MSEYPGLRREAERKIEDYRSGGLPDGIHKQNAREIVRTARALLAALDWKRATLKGKPWDGKHASDRLDALEREAGGGDAD